jgi:hypothetical protein
MTTDTTRALLEQALNALTSFEQNYGSLWYSSYEPDQIDATCSSLRAELAKPSAPAWHDAPTEPGIWLCDEGGPDCYTRTAHNIVLLNDPALKDDECRWYGPIPQDGAKAQGGAA